jgi:hypothetical protein
MSETPEAWLEQLFEFEFCAECGGDANDHEVCIIPGVGTYFARCLREDEANSSETRVRPTGMSMTPPKGE